MADALKNQFGPEIAKRLAADISRIYPAFTVAAFLHDALTGYESLELIPRARHLANALHKHLPEDYPTAISILLRTLSPVLTETERNGMAPFFYLPHTLFVGQYGLDHFEESMHAQYELTQRFTAEFSIRPYLERYPDETLARLRLWTNDPSVHVRRLVSEGTRPRLPWAPRLRSLQKDPTPGIELLELLKDDSDLYVRRSVANHLNDIGKDHPSILIEIANRWKTSATAERLWVIKHGLRSLIKQGNAEALAVLGFPQKTSTAVLTPLLSPSNPAIGEAVTLSFTLKNTKPQAQRVLVDFRIFFVKANGQAKPKVFKLQTVELEPHGEIRLSKKVSLAKMSTRQHYPGLHTVEILVNGQVFPAGNFHLR
ncbi:MAG: DNA alkylation repair protein [Verrucomicrobiota bacterium]